MLAIGLSYKDALAIVAIAFLTVSIVISLNGAIGVLYHAPFPVLARASWGFWGSYGRFRRPRSRWSLIAQWPLYLGSSWPCSGLLFKRPTVAMSSK